MLRVMSLENSHSLTRSMMTALRSMLVLGALALAACSDKSEAPAAAESSSGSEGPSVKERVDSAHEKFKADIRPAASWVDEKSHRVADEARSAVKKGADKLDGDDDDPDHGKAPSAAPSATPVQEPAPATPPTTK